MTTTGTEPDQPTVYEIRIKGHLGSRWDRWFKPMTITPGAHGETILAGPIVDQAALHGLLTKVRDLGLPLVSVMKVEPAQADGPDGNADTDRHRSNKETHA
jgi:hypothetical protein